MHADSWFGTFEPYVGPTRELARRIAEAYRYPLSEDDRDDLPQVAQYLETTQGPDLLTSVVRSEVGRQVVRNYGRLLPRLLNGQSLGERLQNMVPDESAALLLSVWRHRCDGEPNEPHRILADLPFHRYITTNPDPILETALTVKNRKPKVWNCGRRYYSTPETLKKNFVPSREQPLLVYLYGSLDHADDLVLSEDNYFEHLINAARQQPRNVAELTSAFTGTALLFLGFRLEEWDFRILLRCMKMLNGWENHKRFRHVAVQLDAAYVRTGSEMRRVENFLRNLLRDTTIEIYRGTPENFMEQLRSQWGPPPTVPDDTLLAAGQAIGR